ncbi:structural maintenance of chromosomes protein 2-like [Stylophora pistillata]|uniref:Uncharacterized protein n=1 Tax=Stylophora pistillata TaxID=50429 RepID=A0A2B4RY41_STYPI|nr:structural maintenance of chromosomes protein 2-like [Stylophora pistillata]PFX21719.1 hypothetical protein AWC38_SpisGene13798 [Stylophora pistillata]
MQLAHVTNAWEKTSLLTNSGYISLFKATNKHLSKSSLNMALVSVSEKCFNTIESALKAVKTGDIRSSEIMLKSLGNDGLLVQQQASVYCDRLREAENEHKQQVEAITRQINELYQEQKQHEKRKKELEANKSVLRSKKNHYIQGKREALRKYQEVEWQKREAEEKFEELKTFWWVPIYGQYLVVRELFEENDKKARHASREMHRHERDAEEAERDIERTNSGIRQAEEDMRRISEKVEQLERQRQHCHNNLGDVKSMVVFIIQAVTFWKEVVELTRAATVKTENIQKIVELAQKKDSIKILTSRGTQIKMKSFKECWMDLIQTINSDENNVIFQRYAKAAIS